MKKHIKRLLACIIGIAFIGIMGAGIIFKEELMITKTIKQVDTQLPVYTMEIMGDYHFDEFLEQGGAASDQEVSAFLTKCISHGFYQVEAENKGAGCSVLSAMNEAGAHVWGRNFDWPASVPIIVKSKPKDGYASISTCEFGNITGSSTALPDNIANKMLAIAALYVPMDGINEKGLCVADLEDNEGGMIDKDTEKPDLTITTAIRLLLNKAADVEKAIELLKQYDIHASAHISHHLAISDAEGGAAVIEFVEGKIVVVDSPYVTNFNLANGDRAAGGESAMKRFEILEDIYDQNDGQLNTMQIKEALMKVAQNEGKSQTQWSVIYDNNTKSAEYYFASHFDQPIRIQMAD